MRVGARSPSTHRRRRLETVVRTLGGDVPPDETGLVRRFSELLADAEPSDVWLALAVLRAQLPLDAEVDSARRAIRLDGPRAAFAAHARATRNPLGRGQNLREVEVAVGEVLVDVHHTARTDLATGIQRVARQTVRRWDRDHPISLVGWTGDGRALRRLGPDERRVALLGGPVDQRRPADSTVVVPWRCTYVLPELAVEQPRTERILAMARHANSRTGVIGFDCVPLSSGETTAPGMGGAFAGNLAAVRHVDRVATISDAAALEYTGWRQMLTGTGLPGPHIAAVDLPVQAESASSSDVERARQRFSPDGLRVLLCVGSHEPRKNHLAVLEAAESAWRSGSRFRLVFVGGNSWGAADFRARLAEIQGRGRPVRTESALPDQELWAAYALARAVVFPSLNEGYGLPVAEALASGTPVITSNFGSMAQIARHGGALLVDPRDDDALGRAVRAVLEDDALHARLQREARELIPAGNWDDYADEVWGFLVDGVPAGTVA